LLQLGAMMAFAPFTRLRWIPARLKRVPITTLQPASTTPVDWIQGLGFTRQRSGQNVIKAMPGFWDHIGKGSLFYRIA
jgi:hypothetical protein